MISMWRRLALVSLLAAASCSKGSEAPPPGAGTQPTQTAPASPAASRRDPEAAKKLIAEGAVVIDVRTPEEFEPEHLPNATNIPVGELGGKLAEVDKLAGGDKAKPIVVYCASGGRAAKAARALSAAGYTHVVNGGGLDDLR